MRERLSVTVPEELIKKAKDMAKKEDRTLSAMIAVLLREAIARKEKAA
jgi:metal-responsive CopG/Arc/MetJ family transcriptional regulator